MTRQNGGNRAGPAERGVRLGDAPGPRPPLLDVRDLRVEFPGADGATLAPVDGMDFVVGDGERVGLVGESGSGKSLTALAVLGLVDRLGGRLAPQSRIVFQGKELTQAKESDLRRLRGGQVAMIFQDPLTSLNPVHKVGRQILEAIALHQPERRDNDARAWAVELLRQVQLPRPERLIDAYPHELSGGMRQRVMIAMALAGDPALLIADEPTTALDVTVQAEILDLLHDLSERRGLAVLLITHDLGIVAGFTHRVLVMYGGRLAESGPTDDMYSKPLHPYSSALMGSIAPVGRRDLRLTAIPGVPPEPANRPSGCVFHPRCQFAEERCQIDTPSMREISAEPPSTMPDMDAKDSPENMRRVACIRVEELNLSPYGSVTTEPRGGKASASGPTAAMAPLIEVRDLTKQFRIKGERTWRRDVFTAVSGVSFDVHKGEALGIVGESGSGKSTLVRCLLRLIEPTSGSVRYNGDDLLAASSREVRKLRRDLQMVFQDPGSSLDGRMRVRQILAEPLRIHGLWGERGYDEERLRELLDIVRLPSDSLQRYPHQFSGGQRQRISIARALALQPTVLVCDEPVSALDVSVRSSILNLLADLRDEFDLTLIFIAHDLPLVRFLCERVGVMYQGELVELKDNVELFNNPTHPHTRALLAAQPEPNPPREREMRARRRAIRAAGGPELAPATQPKS